MFQQIREHSIGIQIEKGGAPRVHRLRMQKVLFLPLFCFDSEVLNPRMTHGTHTVLQVCSRKVCTGAATHRLADPLFCGVLSIFLIQNIAFKTASSERLNPFALQLHLLSVPKNRTEISFRINSSI